MKQLCQIHQVKTTDLKCLLETFSYLQMGENEVEPTPGWGFLSVPGRRISEVSRLLVLLHKIVDFKGCRFFKQKVFEK